MTLDEALACARSDAWARAWGGAMIRAAFKREPEDFQVDEDLGFEASGSGEFLLVHLEKSGWNTARAARALADFSGVAPAAVSWSGLKDRQAVTRQWLSIHLPGKPDPELGAFDHPQLRILEAARHARKLRPGSHRGNVFRIRLREVAGDRDAADACLTRMREAGVPNYFGPQRFGRAGSNLERALSLFRAGRRVPRREGMLLSAARSLLFNAVLDARVRDDSWSRALAGDQWIFDGSGSRFGPEPVSEDIEGRLAEGEIHPTGPLWGRGRSTVEAAVHSREQELAEALDPIGPGLERAGLSMDRRALRLRPGDLAWAWRGDDLELEFRLPRGAFATALLRELLDLSTSGGG